MTEKIPYSDDDILNAFKRTQGNVRKSAEELGVSHNVLYNRIGANPNLETQLLELRKNKYFEKSDYAEDQIIRIMAKAEEYPSTALNAARYWLETHAKRRGYGKIDQPNTLSPNDGKIDYEHELMRKNARIRELEEQLSNDNKS